MVIELVNNLGKEAEFLTNKINEGIKKYSIIFDGEEKIEDKLKKLEQNQLLLEFIGLDNIKLIEDSYKSIKK